MTQGDLWHDTPEDALKSVLVGVYGRGWNKRAAADMWPTDDPYDKGKYLEKALTPGRNEKLGLPEIVWILRKGREHGIHTGFAFFARECDYAWQPIDPKDEAVELQRQFIRSVEEQKALLERLQRVQVRVAS